MRNFTVKYYYTDGTVPGFTFNGAPFTGVAATNYRNMPNIIGAAPTTIYGPTNLATSTFIPTTGSSGTITLPLIANSFKWNGSTNKLVIEMVWDNTSSGIVPLGGTEGTTFTQTSTQGYRHAIGISETRLTSTYPAANFVVPFTALPQTSTAGAVTWTAGTNTMASTYANATFAVGQWVSGTGISIIKSALTTVIGNGTINVATGTTGIQVGMYVNPTAGWAAGVAPQVTAVTGTTVTVSPAPTLASASATLTFCPYITALSSATPPYSAITLNCNLPGPTTAGNLNIGALHSTPTVGYDYRSNLTFKVRRPYGKFPIEVRKDWVNQGEFVAGVSRVSMTTTTAGVVDSMYNASPTSFYDLVINNSDGVNLYNADITIKDTLTFTAGRLKANNQLITLANDTLPGVLVRTAGGIQLDQDLLGSDVAPYGRFQWKMGSAIGSLDIPLYNQANTYIPFTYNRISGSHDLTIATYSTPGSNQNLPSTINSFTSLNNIWTNGDGAVDRFYRISNSGTSPVASLTFRYSNSERAVIGNSNMRVQRWLGTQWERPIGLGGTFPFPNQVHTIASPADGVLVPNFNLMSATGQWMTIVSETAPLSDTIAPAVFISGVFSACQGNAATLTATAGFVSYLWNTGATTQNINPTVAGTYTVTATTSAGATVTASQAVTINQNPSPAISGTTTICQNSSTTITATAGYNNYLWNTGATTGAITITPSATTSYTVTVTDSYGCTGTNNTTVTVNQNPSPSITGTFNPCSGSAATLTATAGFNSYLWSNGAITQTINTTVAGTYTVTVTDSNGCTGSVSQAVTFTPNPTPTISGTFTVCQGFAATLTASAGFTTYLWSTGANTQTIYPNSAGNYTVTVTDANGCMGSASQTVVVNNNPTPAIGGNFSICQGSTSTLTASSGFNAYLWNTGATTTSINTTTAGTFTVTVTDGNGCTGSTSQSVVVNTNPTTSISGTFSVCQGTAATLSAGSGFNTYLWNTGANTQTINPTAAGTYTVTVTNNNGCTGSASQAVTVITNPVPNITGTFAVCQGNAATLTATSGYATYLWNTGATTQTINPTVAGTYTVTVTASGGCSGSKSQVVTINANPTPSITGTTTICQNSSTTLTATAGFSSYAWSTGATTAAITVTPSTSTTYTVTVTNSNGCTGNASTSVTVNARPTPTITGTLNPCSGSAATLTASATGAISYAWNTGATTQTINPTTAGTYTVTATNSNGCTGTASQAVTITSNPVPNITGTFSVCQGNAATLTATAGYTAYLWNTGATTQTINPTLAGTYTVTVTASSGCTGSKSQAVTINANPTPSITGTTTICQNSSTTLTATAGFSSYSWSTGATTAAITVTPSATTTYTVTVTNSNGCSGSTATSVTVNPRPVPTISGTFGVCSGAAATLTANATGATSYLWNTGAVTQTINPTTAGTYTATVTNSFGCTGTASQAVTITSNPVPSITGTFIVCQGNTATLTATAGYTSYLWNTGATTQTINPSAAGTYTVTVTGTGGCTGSQSQSVTVNPLPTVSISGSSTVCQGTTTTWTATSGLTSYLWSTGATTASINVGTAGTYTVTATNSNGCSNTSSKQLTVNPTNATTQNVNRCPGTSYTLPSGQTVSVAGTYNSTLTNIYGCDSVVTTVLTFNDNIAPVASGCPAAFTTCNPATWTPPTFTDNCTFNVSSNFQPGVNLPLGNTTVTYTATDAGGNSTVCSFIITVVDFTLNTSQNNVTCFGFSNGSATVTATGTSGAVSYLWSNGATGATNTNLAAGTYSVTVTNGNCSKQTSVSITQPAQFNAAITPSGATTFCQGGSVTLTATAATSYLWNTGATTQSVAATTSGNYFATVTNALGCTSVTAPVTVTVNPNVTASVSIASSATGSVSPTTSVTFTATAINGGASPSFQWKKNGVNVGTNSSTYTNNAWVNLDVVTCVMTSNAVCVSGSPATSNAITVYVTTGGGGGAGTCKFVVSDVTANRVYYYDSTFTFIVSNPLSTNVLNGNTNASDVFMTATNGYILDGTANSRVYRSSLSGTVSVASRQLRTNTGAGLNPTTGLIIRGDTLYVVDKKGKAIYNYYLSQAYNGATTTLNAFAVKTLLTANSTAEALSFDGTYFYVLDNGSSVKSIYRYPLVGTAAGVRSRPMKTNTGANLGTVRGIVIDGNTVWITDSGSDRAFPYDKTLLFTGSNTINLNATTVKTLNSGNLNSTGISITNTSSLLRQELPLQNDLHVTVWPNPTSGVINISLEGIDANERFTLRAYDMNGRLVAFREEAGTDTEFAPAFDLTGIKSGMYAIVVEQGNRRKTVRVIVD
ncbi:MAG: HYR domain-containing protein [Bacteroidota bacterium]